MRHGGAVVLALLVVGCSIHSTSKQNATEFESMFVDGVVREWRMYVPPAYARGRATALLIDFHGTGSNPDNQAQLSGFESLAAEQGFLVVSPAAAYPLSGTEMMTWNVDLHEDGVNDVRFIRRLIGQLSKRFTVDPNRIYATGFSGGARMASRLACDLSDMIAAIGPVAGIRFPEDCRPERAVPVIAFHGIQDQINHYVHRADSPPYWRMGVEDAISGWTGNNGCSGKAAVTTITTTVSRISYQDCSPGGEIVFYRSAAAGHTWPGSPQAKRLEQFGLGETDADIPATRWIWDFFLQH